MNYHPLLQRQLEKLDLLDDPAQAPPEQLEKLLDVVSQIYTNTNEISDALERSLFTSPTDVKALYQQQKSSYEGRLHAIIKALPDPLFLFDEDGRYLEIPSNHERQLRGKVEELKDQLLHEIMPAEKADIFLKAIHEALETGRLTLIEYDLKVPAGHHHFEGRVMDANFRVNNKRTVVFLAMDITRIKESEEHIRKLAYHDDVTGLANRVDCHQQIDLTIKAAQLCGQRFALLFLDLDGFKDINDSLGHKAGDKLLQIIGTRLQSVLGETAFIARQGGDEFCVLIENITDGYLVAQMAEECLEAITKPVVISARELRPRASIGITLFPEDGQDREQLLQAADSAMYAAKHAGKHRYSFYTPELTAKAEERLSLEHDLRRSIGTDEFKLHYQPQIALASGKMVGVEALIRWHHPERGFIQPDQFIEIAERIGLISKLGEWVLLTACKQIKTWHQMGASNLRMAINISGTQFQDEHFAGTVRDALNITGVEPAALELEITEGVMQTTEKSIATFKCLKELGIGIAIDDFGTGYSCLSSLKQLPIDCLKVDRTFLHGLLENPDDSVIIATIIGMGHALGLSVVAEGVETQEQVQYLYGIGCDLVQGYYFSKPVTADQIPALATKRFMPKRRVV